MKQKITFAICAVLLLAGIFGLQAVSESSLSLWEGAGAILLICALESPVIAVANRTIKKETL